MKQLINDISDAEIEEFKETARLSEHDADQLIREFMRNYVEKQRNEAYVRVEVEKGLADIAAGRVADGEKVDAEMLAQLEQWESEGRAE